MSVTGRRLGIDVGTVRVGVAVSDPAGILATPLVTLGRGRGDLTRLAALVTEHEVVEVVVGLPVHLSGRAGASAADAQAYAERLRGLLGAVPVRLVDERLSTVGASRSLRSGGVSARNQRRVVDQAAAAFILQGWLDGGARNCD